MRFLLFFVFLLIATVTSCAFTAFYGIRSPWYNNLVGRMQFTKSLCLAVTLLFTLINSLFRYRGEVVVGTIIMGALAFALVFQLVVLLRIQNGSLDRHKRYNGKESDATPPHS